MTRQRLQTNGCGWRLIAGAMMVAGMTYSAMPTIAQVAQAGGGMPTAIEHQGQSFRVVRADGVATAGTGSIADMGSRASTGSMAGNVSASGHGASASLSKTARQSNIRQVGLIGDILHGRQNACDGMGCDGCSTCAMGGDYTVGTYCGGGQCGGSCGGTCGGQMMCGGQCGGTCQSCGSYGPAKTCCGTTYGHYNGPLCDPCFNPCNTFNNPCAGKLCMPYIYLGLEGLYFGRGGDGDADYDGAPGGRFTFGRIPDCATGCEIVGTGLFGFDGDDAISTTRGFAAGTELRGEYEADFYSLEISKVRLVDDFAKLRFGGRYIRYEEDFENGEGFDIGPTPTAPIGGGPTLVQILGANNGVENNLIGGQIGLDVFYPISQRWYIDGRGRAGAYINFAEIDGQVRGRTETRTSVAPVFNPVTGDLITPGFINSNNTTDTANFDDEDEELAGMFEAGLGIRYLASRRTSFFLRGEVWYLSGVATSRQTLRRSVQSGISTGIDLDDDVVFYGGSGGVEIKF